MRLARRCQRRVVKAPFAAPLRYWLSLIAACLSVLCFVAGVRADDRRTIEKELNQTYDRHTVVLRGFPSGKSLAYDSQGNLIEGGSEGAWTIDGSVQILKIHLGRDQIEIKGDRIMAAYQPREKSFEQFRGEPISIKVNLAAEP